MSAETKLPRSPKSLSAFAKAVYASGDFTVNTALSSLSLIYTSYFLIEIAGLRPILAGLVPLIGRFVDAITDPAMGRISDHTRWKAGRRRPYFLIGALPYGITFALLWFDAPFTDPTARFAYYALTYCAMSLALTVITVPYLALIPEMATHYDGRTSINAYRNVGSLFGVGLAIAIRPIAEAFGGGSEGFAWAGVLLGVIVSVPWLAVHRVSFERPDFFGRPAAIGIREGLRFAASHKNFRTLTAIYLCGRIAMDLMGALLILYFTHWLGRSEDFEKLMALFLISVVFVLPFWLRISVHYDKSTLFVVGSMMWAVMLLTLLLPGPDWPRWPLLLFGPVTAIGYAVVDLMPWAMIGDVIDEDDLRTGERREGLYNGVFMFVRKLGGAIAVFGCLSILDVVGMTGGADQTEAVRTAIRYMAALAPTAFLALGVYFAIGYPLGRQAHGEILSGISSRETEN